MTRKQQIELMASNGEPSPKEELKSWALVELFGHQRIVGFLTAATMGGSGVLFRVDVPSLIKDGKESRAAFTRYFGIGAIYSITPVTESMVREMLPHVDGLPAPTPLSFSRESEERW